MAVLIMAQQSRANNANIDGTSSITSQQQEVKAMFHDFLGMKASSDSPVVLAPKNPDASPSASASLGASSGGGGAGGGGGGGGGRGPLSTTSDLASERQIGNHLEGIPFYGPRSDISGREISNRLAGSKRSNSDSAFTGSIRDGIPQMGHDSSDGLQLMKMLKNGGGGERPRRSNDDEIFYAMQSMRPTSASLMLQPSTGGRLDTSISKWERPISMGAAVPYPPRGGQLVPLAHQVSANRFKDTNASPSIISQSAADEGSRTGIKGPGILSTINAAAGMSEKNASGMLPSGSKSKAATHTSEPESSTPSSRQGLTGANRQMTIFYGGQAYVFDDVHPNKADVIMALAGSNGGSWSTTYSPKPAARPSNESYMTSGEHEAGAMANMVFQHDFRGRLSAAGNTTQELSSGDRISTPIGGHHGSIMMSKDGRNHPVQAGEPSKEEKREV